MAKQDSIENLFDLEQEEDSLFYASDQKAVLAPRTLPPNKVVDSSREKVGQSTLDLDEEDIEGILVPPPLPIEEPVPLSKSKQAVADAQSQLNSQSELPQQTTTGPLRAQVLSHQTERIGPALAAQQKKRLAKIAGVIAVLCCCVVGLWLFFKLERKKQAPLVESTSVKVPIHILGIDSGLSRVRDSGSTPDSVKSQIVKQQQGLKKRAMIVVESEGKPKDPLLANDLYKQGLLKLLVGQHKEAVSIFNQVIKMDGGFSLAYRGLGLAFEKQGRNTLAKAAYQRYLILKPKAEDAAAIRERIERLKD